MGATGSIGKSTLSLVRQFPESYSVYGLVAGDDVVGLSKLAEEFKPQIIGINNKKK